MIFLVSSLILNRLLILVTMSIQTKAKRSFLWAKNENLEVTEIRFWNKVLLHHSLPNWFPLYLLLSLFLFVIRILPAIKQNN